MDYEKAYKDALERAKSFELQEYKNIMAYVFPELAESEDERIRKWLEETIESMSDNNIIFNDVRRIDVLHWLEKQGEKPQVDGFDAELNALLKKYEHLPKEEILGCLNFYVLVLGKEMEEQWNFTAKRKK